MSGYTGNWPLVLCDDYGLLIAEEVLFDRFSIENETDAVYRMTDQITHDVILIKTEESVPP